MCLNSQSVSDLIRHKQLLHTVTATPILYAHNKARNQIVDLHLQKFRIPTCCKRCGEGGVRGGEGGGGGGKTPQVYHSHLQHAHSLPDILLLAVEC